MTFPGQPPSDSLLPTTPDQTPHQDRLHRARAALRAIDEDTDSATNATASLPPLRPLPCMALARGRAHEFTGPARHSLAVLTAGAAAREGPVIWLRPDWRPETLCPQGFEALAGPEARLSEALILANCRREEDILAAMEEALRAGCVALVVAEIGTTPDLRQIRRLHLAAAEGGARAVPNNTGGTLTPLGLLLAQERTESSIAGVESRWALHPRAPAPTSSMLADTVPGWRLQRQLARGAPPAQWNLAGTRPPTIDPMAPPA